MTLALRRPIHATPAPLRDQWARLIAVGNVICGDRRCRERIKPDQPWRLLWDFNRRTWLTPAHVECPDRLPHPEDEDSPFDRATFCAEDGCTRAAYRRGLCRRHVPPPTPRPVTAAREPSPCGVDDCDRPMTKQGKCARHFREWREKYAARRCDVPDCDGPHVAKGYCRRHYQQARGA